MVAIRDIVLRQQSKFETKQDRQMFRRAVLTTEGGLQTSSDPLNDVWANRNERRVWHMADGATQPAQVLCRKVSNPYVGLGVIIGYADGSNAKEVLTTDFFLTGAGTNLDGWDDTGPEDLEPGGNKLHWVYTKVITPLATYPDPTGLTVNVIRGDYPYLGSRKTFAGSASYALTQNPNPGEHYLAGLYLDAANTLQVVYGTSVSTAVTAPEPSWPAGAFRLSVVLIDDVQTSIDFDTDIFDRRLAWSDEQAGGSGWPFSQEVTIDPTDPDADESTIAAGLAAASANYLLTAGVATYAETIALNKNVTLLGRSGSRTFITGPFSITSLGGELENVWLLVSSGTQAFTASVTTTITNCRIDHTPGNDAKAIVCSTATMTLRGVIATSTGGTTSRVLEVTGGTCLVDDDCDFQALGAGTKADVYISGGTVRLNGPILRNGTITNTGGTVTGWYRDANGNIYIISGTGISSGVWLVDESATLRTKYATFNDALTAANDGDTIFLDSDTYTVTTTTITKSITIAGNGPEATILQGSNGANAQLLDIATNSITVVFKDLTIDCNAGDGTYGGAIFGDNSGITVILDNAVVKKTGGAPGSGFGIGPAAGTWILRNSAKASATVGTNKYGVLNITGAATITVGPGCEVTGATYDVYGDQSGSTLSIYGGILTNNLMSWAGNLDRSGHISFERGRPNPVINGAFQVWQRGTSFAGIVNGTFSADRWIYGVVGAAVHTVSRSTDVPTVAQAGQLVPYSALIDCTTADASIAAGDYTQWRTAIEGYDWTHLAQRSLNISFWVKATKTGVYCVSLRNSGVDRSYVAEYTVNAADTWEYKQVLAPASPSAGTWDYTNGVGAYLTFTLACGSTFQTTAGAWQTGNFFGTSNQVNATDSTSNDFRLALVKMEPGVVATPFVLPDYQAELARSQRYCWTLAAESGNNQGQGAKLSTTVIALQFKHPVTMRAAPTLTHNITGYTGGVPGTTTVGIVDYARNAFFAITGALTVALGAGGVDYSNITFTAGTSWDGTAGNLATLRTGPSVVATLSADI